MTITLLGEPRSTNHVYKHSCSRGFLHSYMTPEGKPLKEDHQWQARSQFLGDPLAVPLRLDITVFHGIRRRHDWDNFHKISMDALNGIVWKDDSQITDAAVHRRYDKGNQRIESGVTPG